MQKLLILLIAVISIFGIFGCSEKDDNPTDINVYGYKLDQFVNQALVADSIDSDAPDTLDFRGLYAYEIVSAEDGFSPRMSAYAGYDLDWAAFKEGYFVPSDNNRTWFADASLPGAFRVRDAGYFRLYRKIDVIAPDETSKLVELGGLPTYTITNWDGEDETAVKLSDLLTGIAGYDSVEIVCYDNYGEGRSYTPEHISAGYYLLTTERTIFPGITFPIYGMSKLKKVSYMRVYSVEIMGQNHEFELAPSNLADMIFTVPSNLSGYEETPLEGYPQ